ncbi:MAG: hypothetical protein JO131_08250 [Gammaproteobacteria bacterium]|nr:hypothetical protein [Gammaproteobacteria bacterium]
MSGVKTGDRITLSYEGREFDAIVIDPNGLGQGQPSVGFGFRMGERYAGVPESTLRGWVREKDGDNCVELPSGKALRVRDIFGSDGNLYRVIEASDWFALAIDLLINPGKTGKALRAKLGDFIGWFAVKGFYAEAYVAFKGVYTQKDSRATTQWLEARQLGKVARKLYTDLLQAEGCQDYDYGNWTNYVYVGLFGIKKKEMTEIWELVDGDPNIGRNYIPKAEGLEAVCYCEDMVVRLFVDDLEEAHNDAIKHTKRKFLGGS